MSLPAGATPVDFAYAVHTEVGHKTMGARVNGRLVALDTELKNGDSVEVFTSKDENAGPSRDWARLRSRARAPGRRSASGSPRSAAKRRSRTAASSSPGRCAAIPFPRTP
ncbi:Bifunctional (p)ppGpp synthase/hydrolase relA [Brevibacterium casei]|uniref:Bifunctional (P)ppGpp synthase/hydrolase relA n=1 Tax=Brevibacterium casei TaxID=33889 RepID=A0A449D1Q6_9MICO|nr:Bifunctional (p)ppGpp synthase/hydrolase relA [Brevibacterium casei]